MRVKKVVSAMPYEFGGKVYHKGSSFYLEALHEVRCHILSDKTHKISYLYDHDGNRTEKLFEDQFNELEREGVFEQ